MADSLCVYVVLSSTLPMRGAVSPAMIGLMVDAALARRLGTVIR
jgi:hypothetical protein